MTDEEMAEEYAKGLCKTCTVDTCRYNTLQTCAIKESLKQAYLAGLEAGRPKWHKVADGDLPKDENDVLVYSGEDWRMCVGRYSPKYKAWETGCDTIAWCEIPKYTEE